jgi:hypothetical protein
MLIIKATQVRFVMEEGPAVSCRGVLMHDPGGRGWPSCSCLIMSAPRGGRAATDAEMKGAPRHYLGRGYEGRVGSVKLPPKALSEWDLVGTVERITYRRTGIRAPGKYYHDFGKRILANLFIKGKRPLLYKRGTAYRLELHSGCKLDDRGFVQP